MAPQVNWPTASAKLMVTMPSPVEVVDRADEQAERLAGAHGDHQDPGRGQGRQPAPRAADGAKHVVIRHRKIGLDAPTIGNKFKYK
jgi:hypothetical protein